MTIDINALTVGELKELAGIAAAIGGCQPSASSAPGKHWSIGEYCVIRSYSAGVHAGFVERNDEKRGVVTLRDARRCWYFKNEKDLACSGLARTGITSQSRICAAIATHDVHEVIEVLKCTSNAAASIQGAPTAEQR